MLRRVAAPVARPTQQRATDARQINSVMLEEAPVFDGANGVGEHGRNVRIGERGARAGLRRGIGRQRFRFKHERIERDAVARDFIDAPLAIKRDAHDFGRESFRRVLRLHATRADLNRAFDRAKRTAPHIARRLFDVTGAAQSFDETLARKILTRAQHARRGIESGAAR
jgi:hypothetical protein